MSKFYEHITESVWTDMQKRSSGEEFRREDDIPEDIKEVLSRYINMFAFRCYYQGDYTAQSAPDFRAFVRDNADNPKIKELNPNISDVINYFEHTNNWNKVVLPLILKAVNQVDKDEEQLVDKLWDELHSTNESIWTDMQKRSSGDEIREEEITEEFLQSVNGCFVVFSMMVVYHLTEKEYEPNLDDFCKYLEVDKKDEDPGTIKKIITYVNSHQDECEKMLDKCMTFEKKLFEEKVICYIHRFVDDIVYCEKYHNTLSDIKRYASERFRNDNSCEHFFPTKNMISKKKSELFDNYIEDNWPTGYLKKKIDELIKKENDDMLKYGFKKEPGKTIADTVNDWWDSLDDSKRDELAWDEFGEDAEEAWMSEHHRDVDYDGEDFDSDEWWDDSYYIRRVHIYSQEHSKKNESVWTDMQKRSSGDEIRKEDDVNLLDIDGLYEYIKSKYEKRLFYLDKDTFGKNNKRNIVVDVMANISLFTNYNKSGKFDHILLSWTKEKIAMPFFDKLRERFNVQMPNANRRTITEKDGTCTNQTYIDVIDFFLDNIDNMLVNESVWTDIQKRSSGEEMRKEDEVLTDMEINALNEFTLMYCRGERAHYIQNHIVPPPPSRRKENDYEGLIKYIEDRRDENLFTNVGDYDKIIRYIKKNWDKLNMDTYIKKWICSPDVMKGKKIVECEGVPGGATPANVGGMGAAYFPGPNGEPGSGDLPSPTGIVYHQVAPFGVFIKELKKKKKKKKFRKEDEPCSHSPNAKVYDYVDDYREYVDRTYTMMNRKK